MRSISPYERFGEFNPDTDANLKTHVWNASDTVTGLAHRVYEDWRQWRLIADRNRLVDVRQIEPGTILLIPEQPLERGQFEIA
jgi:nucleoid-associated protein YgaU